MATDLVDRCDAIEACYEPLLGYAGRGFPGDESGESRQYLELARAALKGLAQASDTALKKASPKSAAASLNYLSVLERDGSASLAAIEMVLGQPVISSQLVDNFNASIPFRALLTDLFLIGGIVDASASPVVGKS